VAIQFAYNQLGKPYVWGAEGDNFHDCSGLMQQASSCPGPPASSGTPAPGSQTQPMIRNDYIGAVRPTAAA
jgi:hypothetical protein